MSKSIIPAFSYQVSQNLSTVFTCFSMTMSICAKELIKMMSMLYIYNWNTRWLFGKNFRMHLEECLSYLNTFIMSWPGVLMKKRGPNIPVLKANQQRIRSQISIQDSRYNDQKFIVVQKEVSEDHKTLRCFKSKDGHEQEQMTWSKLIGDKFGIQVKSAKLIENIC